MGTEIVVKTTFKLRRGLKADWERKNPVLAEGEPGVELDTGVLKIGNGTTAWKDLPSVQGTVAPETKEKIDELSNDVEELKSTTVRQVKIKEKTVLPEEGVIDFPQASDSQLGLVIGNNDVGINNDGSILIHKVNTNTLVQNDGDVISLISGNAND